MIIIIVILIIMIITIIIIIIKMNHVIHSPKTSPLGHVTSI